MSLPSSYMSIFHNALLRKSSQKIRADYTMQCRFNILRSLCLLKLSVVFVLMETDGSRFLQAKILEATDTQKHFISPRGRAATLTISQPSCSIPWNTPFKTFSCISPDYFLSFIAIFNEQPSICLVRISAKLHR